MPSLEEIVRTLSAYPTRHASSPYNAQAADWIANEFAKIRGVRVERMRFTIPEGPRVPVTKEIEQILAWIDGETPEIIGLGAHFDSINMSDPRSIDLPAPGANDDLSGIAAVLETARRWAETPRRHRGLFVAFNAEEQGLLGGKALATRATAEKWAVQAFLNLDMIGNTGAESMVSQDREIRVYSDEASRELARLAEYIQQGSGDPFRIKLVLRPDRIRRGGDHTPLANAGYRAIRFTEALERYEVQHSPADTADHVDFAYLRKVTDCVGHVAVALADAPEPPSEVRAERNGQRTRLQWHGPADAVWTVYWRDTRRAEWEGSGTAKGNSVELPVNLDDQFFAVGAPGGVPVPAKI